MTLSRNCEKDWGDSKETDTDPPSASGTAGPCTVCLRLHQDSSWHLSQELLAITEPTAVAESATSHKQTNLVLVDLSL